MKHFLVLLFCMWSVPGQSQSVSNTKSGSQHHGLIATKLQSVVLKRPTSVFVPRLEILRGNVFCRFEDKLKRATRVWIKLGVK